MSEAYERTSRFTPGQRVYILCARVDPYGTCYGEESEPAIDTKGFSWLPLVVVAPIGAGELVRLRHEDDSTTEYEERFLHTRDEALALRLPEPT